MGNRNVRWLKLAAFALANLIFWVGISAAIWRIVSPGLDFGLEALMREGQATAVAMWDHLGEPRPSATATPEDASPPGGESDIGGEQPMAAILTPGDPALTAMPEPETTQEAEGSTQPAIQPTPQPRATLASSPLLLTDPQISDIAPLDAEMARSAPERAVQIRYEEGALNAEIAALWRNNPDLPYRHVRVDLMRDQVVVTGQVSVLGFSIDAELTGKVTAEDCAPVLEIDRLRLAGVMTPAFVRDEVEGMIHEAMAWYPADYPLCLEQIVLEEMSATLYGYRR
ncbi:MAG: hypothetical protein PVI67_03655 [Anaerolineae bacterium]|jgi:hypothetical protein